MKLPEHLEVPRTTEKCKNQELEYPHRNFGSPRNSRETSNTDVKFTVSEKFETFRNFKNGWEGWGTCNIRDSRLCSRSSGKFWTHLESFRNTSNNFKSGYSFIASNFSLNFKHSEFHMMLKRIGYHHRRTNSDFLKLPKLYRDENSDFHRKWEHEEENDSLKVAWRNPKEPSSSLFALIATQMQFTVHFISVVNPHYTVLLAPITTINRRLTFF